MDVYEKLRQLLDAHPTGAPESESFNEILRFLFTPEEAELALKMSFRPMEAPAIAERAGMEPEKTAGMLEAMADKAIIYCREKEGKKLYGLLPTIPGLFEFPFMKGADTPELKRLGRLWKDYHDEALGAEFAASATPLMRVVPVEKSLTPKNRAHPYEEVSRFIDEASYIAVAQCACRESIGACDKPRDVCMIFGPPAEFLVRRGFARQVDKTEARRVLDRAEEAGLIHTSNNSADRANLICNCCPCCCTVLRGRTALNLPNAFATSAFVAEVDADTCDGCGTCADERCSMDAIELKDDVARVIVERCVGCGLCVTGCPSQAISMTRRRRPPEVPESIQQVGLRIAQEKGKLERFLETMKK